MQKGNPIELEDACVVVHTDAGKVQVKQAVNLMSLGAASGLSSGMLIGALAGLLVLNPLAGIAVGGLAGAGFGAISVSMGDYGINDQFIKNLGKTISKGSLALFLLIKRSTPHKVLPEIEPFNPRVRGRAFAAWCRFARHHSMTCTRANRRRYQIQRFSRFWPRPARRLTEFSN